MTQTTKTYQRGFTIIEMLITLALFGLMCVVAFTNINTLESPLVSTSTNLSHYFRLVRVRAIAQTRSIRITPLSNQQLVAETASNCNASTFTPLDDLDFELDDDVKFGDVGWQVCFTQRGLVQTAVSFELTGTNGTRTVEIALGGGVKIE